MFKIKDQTIRQTTTQIVGQITIQIVGQTITQIVGQITTQIVEQITILWMDKKTHRTIYNQETYNKRNNSIQSLKVPSGADNKTSRIKTFQKRNNPTSPTSNQPTWTSAFQKDIMTIIIQLLTNSTKELKIGSSKCGLYLGRLLRPSPKSQMDKTLKSFHSRPVTSNNLWSLLSSEKLPPDYLMLLRLIKSIKYKRARSLETSKRINLRSL